MKFTINKEDLLYALSSVEKAVSNKNILPVLSSILIEADTSGKVKFRATDLDLAIQCVVNAQVEEAGQAAAPGKKLFSLARLLPEGFIALEEHSCQLNIRYGDSSVNISCFSPEEFPLLPEATGDLSGYFTGAQFRKLIKQVGIAAAADEARPVFTGLYTEFAPEQLTMVATDTHRLAKGNSSWQGNGEGNLLIPHRVLQEIARLAISDDDSIQMVAGNNQIFFSFGSLTLTSRLIMGQYPDYNQVIPGDEMFHTQALVSKKALTESLERASLMAYYPSIKNSVVRIVLYEEGMNILAETPDQGSINEMIPGDVQGELFTVSFSIKYLLDALRIIDGDIVKIRFTGPNTPAIISGQEEQDYLYLLLPIRMVR